MSAHSDRGPSSSERWIHCPPSSVLCADIPDEPTDFAKEGTDAHSLCEYRLKKALGQECENPIENLDFYNQEMEEHAAGYVSYVMELLEEAKSLFGDPVVLVEQHVEYERYVKDGFGTADCIIVSNGTLHVVDFKYGMGVEVNAVGNSQMRLYALGALELFDCLYDIDTIQMTIYQPRKANISADTITRDELVQWAEVVLKPAADLAEKGEGEFCSGSWCRFCKARKTCKERARKCLELVAYDFVPAPTLSDDEITDILSKVDSLVSWSDDIKSYALEQAIAGKTWTGFKLVEGRSIRKYTDEDMVAKAAIDAGYEPYEQTLLGITDMQKQMGKKKFEEVLGKLVIKPVGKPVLVSESNKRPPISDAKSEFMN